MMNIMSYDLRWWRWVTAVLVYYGMHQTYWNAAMANQDAKRLYDDLLTNYNRLIRPVGNNSDRLTIKMGLRLAQLIEVNLRNQVMTTSVWVEQEWTDYKLKWNPEDYGGVDYLIVPSEHIWIPDIVLYNNADGNYEVTIMTKAFVHHTGRVVWKPPAIYKSFCEIDLEYFPFDQQTCLMKFGSWTYDGYKVDLQHMLEMKNDSIEMGVDLHDFYLSVEWDVMKVPAVRHEKFYSCCAEPYLDIVFYLTLRRKTLFYTVNLIIPCVGLSFLSVLVFYLPSDSGEKVSLCISILVSLTVFFLLLAEIIPPTSITVPLLGKYLLFTMILVTLSVCVTIFVLNFNFRSPVTHHMRPWMSTVCLKLLPKILRLKRPNKDGDDEQTGNNQLTKSASSTLPVPPHITVNSDENSVAVDYCPGFYRADDSSLLTTLPPPPPPPVFSFPEDYDRNSRPCVVNQSPWLEFERKAGDDDDRSILMAKVGVNDLEAACCRLVCHDAAAAVDDAADKIYTMDKTVEDARFIAQHVKNKEKFDNVIEDWKYIAMVLDRFFLWVFLIVCILGTFLIILQAPLLYDKTEPIDVLYSKIAKKKMLLGMLPTTTTPSPSPALPQLS